MKYEFLKLSVGALFLGTTMLAQTGRTVKQVTPTLNDNHTPMNVVGRGCATQSPNAQWEADFQQLIAQFKSNSSEANKTMANYTIPVVIHVIHGGQTIGTYPNLSNAQVTSQISVLNNDFAGTGLNVANYPATAFTTYATNAGLPAANKDANGRPKISNFNISFCLATIDKNGNTMSEPGVDRVNYNSISTPTSASYPSKNPASYTSISTFQNFIDGYIKPATIWDPTKYMNIWVTDESASVGLLGYATFPIGVSLAGITGNGTATTDGLWCWSKAFGNTGTLQAPYNRGRTATHEIGHWLGLRHIWGDGSCATDYCLDTPPASSSNSGSPSYPYAANSCNSPSGTNNTTPNGANGEMFMNFMDYTNDAAMYMFTEDQRTRAQTVMANGTYRKFLGTHGLCATGSSTPAVAAFSMTNTACNGVAVSVTNNSTGNPTPTYTWSASPATGVTFNPNANSANPTITFANNGSYVVTLSAKSGTTAVSTSTNAITVSTCTGSACSATITNISSTDTMYVGRAGAEAVAGCTPNAGWVFGSNCYKDKEKASFFASAKYSSITNAHVTGAVVVFFKNGTQGTTGTASRAVNLKMYNGTLAAGPTGTTGIATATANLGLITAATATNNLGYLAGNPSVTYVSNVAIPYKYTFPTPVAAPVGGFFLSVTTPTTAGDTAVIMNDFHASTNTSWEMFDDNTWHDMNVSWGGLVNNMAIFPLMTCVTGVDESGLLAANFSIMPNPSNGIFNVLLTLPKTQDVSINVANTLGQEVYKQEYKAFSEGVLSLDLSNKEAGVYFITITNGTEKLVQRIIIAK